MPKKEVNAIGKQSQIMLQDALIELLSKMSFDDITIKAITEKADLSRRTFYRHYDTKEEILSDIFERFYTDYLHSLKDSHVVKLPDITEVFFTFCSQHMTLLHTINKNKLSHLFLEKMNAYMPQVYQQVKGHLNEYEDAETLEYVLAFSVGGHYNVLLFWLKNHADKKPSDMKEIIQMALKVNSI